MAVDKDPSIPLVPRLQNTRMPDVIGYRAARRTAELLARCRQEGLGKAPNKCPTAIRLEKVSGAGCGTRQRSDHCFRKPEISSFSAVETAQRKSSGFISTT